MTARHFYDLLLEYPNHSKKSGFYWEGLSGFVVSIHHKGDENKWYSILTDGIVIVDDRQTHTIYDTDIDHLCGDDFELFDIVQIIKTGYIVLHTKSEYDVKKVISDLCMKIGSYNNLEKRDTHPSLCGAFLMDHDSIVDSFRYFSTNDIELKIQLVRKFCKENISRKHYGLKCIPYIKSIDNAQAFHVEFIENMRDNDYKNAYKRAAESLKELKTMLNQLGVSFKWVEPKTKKPFYRY